MQLEGSGLFSGGGTFKVTFTDAGGLSHTLRGLKKVDVSDPPTVQIANSVCPQTAKELIEEYSK